MRIVWVTDPHLNHVAVAGWDQFIADISDQSPEAILITGDISEGEDVVFQLNRIAESFAKPIYFVLGNHDYYHNSIAKTRRSVIDATRQNPLLHYLTDCEPIDLGNRTWLVGDDGWGDATEGDYDNTPVRLNDFARIEDFYLHHPDRWKSLLNEQGAFSASRLRTKLNQLRADARHIIVATHVPPFCEACWYEGRTTDENWAPFFVCGQVGTVLSEFSRAHGNQQLTVLCGHTHHDGVAKMADNLTVYTGAATYGRPGVEGVLESTLHGDRGQLRVHLARS